MWGWHEDIVSFGGRRCRAPQSWSLDGEHLPGRLGHKVPPHLRPTFQFAPQEAPTTGLTL